MWSFRIILSVPAVLTFPLVTELQPSVLYKNMLPIPLCLATPVLNISIGQWVGQPPNLINCLSAMKQIFIVNREWILLTSASLWLNLANLLPANQMYYSICKTASPDNGESSGLIAKFNKSFFGENKWLCGHYIKLFKKELKMVSPHCDACDQFIIFCTSHLMYYFTKCDN